jgi:transcription initiation factor TFIIB
MNNLSKLSKTNQSRKVKNKIDKKKIWKQFEDDMGKKSQLELLFEEDRKGSREVCELCQSQLFVSDEKFLVCSNEKCGVIYKDCLDATAEWRYYGADDNNSKDPTRCGMPINPLLKESSYACRIMVGYNSTYQMKKIKRYTDWQSMPYKEKAIYDEFQKIISMSRIAGIPKIIIDEALKQHKKISEMKTFRGCNRHGIIAASIYLACRIFDYPRTAKEIAEIFHLDNTSSTKGCKNAVHILNTCENNTEMKDKTYFHQTKPKAFISRFCSKLNINEELTKLCLFVAMKIDKEQLIPENTPQSVAAGIIYFISQICNLNVSKKNVKIASNTSEVTINKCYKKLEKIKDRLIPSIIVKKYNK